VNEKGMGLEWNTSWRKVRTSQNNDAYLRRREKKRSGDRISHEEGDAECRKGELEEASEHLKPGGGSTKCSHQRFLLGCDATSGGWRRPRLEREDKGGGIRCGGNFV